MRTARFHISPPPRFDFLRTVMSHGWCSLLPFSMSADRTGLGRTLALATGTLVHCTLREEAGTIAVTARSRSRLTRSELGDARSQLRTCLRLDEDFSPFHTEAARYPEFQWICETGSGRMLRAPTVFEDAVKMLLTTNCTWALTTIMVTNLVRHCGKVLDDEHRAFPEPAAVASLSERILRNRIKTGYRSPFLLALARDVSEGRLDMESWRTSALPTEELFDEIRSVKGLGPYAAGNLLRLLGRCDYLALDSWVRAQYYRLHHRGRKVKDATIERRYGKYGPWRGLFFWLEMTRDWHDEKFPL